MANEDGYVVNEDDYPERDLADGRSIWLFPLTFGRLRLVVGKTGGQMWDDGY